MNYEKNQLSAVYILEPYKSSFDFIIDEDLDDGHGKREPGYFIVSAINGTSDSETKSLYFGYGVDEENCLKPADAGLSEEEFTPCAILNQIAERDWDTDPLVPEMIGWFISQEEDYAMCPDSHLWVFEVYKRPNEKIIEHFEMAEVEAPQEV